MNPSLPAALLAATAALVLAACGTSTTTVTTTTQAQAVAAAPAPATPPPAWQPSNPEPTISNAEVKAAGLAPGGFIGDADTVLGKILKGDARFGRCARQQVGIHDVDRAIALILAFKRGDTDAQAALGSASSKCIILEDGHTPSYEASLTTDP